MFARTTAFAWIGIIILSGMFLMGQDTWPQQECLDDNDCPTCQVCNVSNQCEPAAIGTPCGDGLTEPTCNPDVCDDLGACSDEPLAVDGTLCAENGGTECCAGSCVDTETDDENCGQCESSCSPAYSCVTGSCECNDDPDCDGVVGIAVACCDQYCTDLDSDDENCGSCGTSCDVGQSCVGSICI